MTIDFVIEGGRERVVIDREAYEDLIDARDHAIAMLKIAEGVPTLTSDEVALYLAAPTPLAYWRKRAGKTQALLAAEAGLSQAFLAQIEAGKRVGSVRALGQIARALRVRLADLVE